MQSFLETAATSFAVLLLAYGVTGAVELTIGLPVGTEPLNIGVKGTIWGLSSAGLMFLTLFAFKQR